MSYASARVESRVAVRGRCQEPCRGCSGCGGAIDDAPMSAASVPDDVTDLVLGGGDVTRWQPLSAVLSANRARDLVRRVWVEAPAAALGTHVLTALAHKGAHGVVVQIEAAGERALRLLRAADGEAVVALAESLGLATRVRLSARPPTLSSLLAAAQRLAPREVALELSAVGFGGALLPFDPAAIDAAIVGIPNVHFSGHRSRTHGFLPPCVMPALWRARPTAFRSVLARGSPPNRALPACASCALRDRCAFDDAAALTPDALASAEPIARGTLPWDRAAANQIEVPAAIVKKRPLRPVVCVTPWTTMEIVDPDGRVRQCCSTWTVGDRGNATSTTLAEVWNGPGYQEARRIMSGASLASLCQPICSRLHDEKFAERELRIQPGSEAFVENQLMLAEDIAERRAVVRSKPLRLALCPSTYCNYDCIMCDHGRLPRRELPASIWDELEGYLPSLLSLTLLGGEPLANPLTMRFLAGFDAAKYPDAAIDLVTNGSLLTGAALSKLRRVTFGNVTVSVNAGTAEVYERVQRGVAFDKLLANIDALLRFRDAHHRWFGITLSFVVQPASAHTLLEFGEIARSRGVTIRLMALNVEDPALDFYTDEGAVSAVLAHVDRFIEYADRARPDWGKEGRAVRAAVSGEAAARLRSLAPRHRLRVVP